MEKAEILAEMVAIYKKYFIVVEEIGAISMSDVDKARLNELDRLLANERNR